MIKGIILDLSYIQNTATETQQTYFFNNMGMTPLIIHPIFPNCLSGTGLL